MERFLKWKKCYYRSKFFFPSWPLLTRGVGGGAGQGEGGKWQSCCPWNLTPFRYIYTVDSRYLEVEGTLWNTSRYPYFDISDLQKWGKYRTNNQISQRTCKITLFIRNICWKYCGKGEKLLLRSNFSSYPQYFVTWCYISMLKQGSDFLFEISGYSR